MSASVSEIKYWLEGSSWWNNGKNEHGDESATYLSYDVFLGLSVLGGFFALDHLYLRSPLTFLAKFLVNIFGFGIWWIYDAAHAIFDTDTIKVYGLGIPGMGPQGIAAGVLSNPQHSAKHWRFFVYAVALFFGGIFGLDSFLVGDRQTGIIRLVCLISLILLPIALLVWAYKVFQFFTNTKSVVGNHSTYFGSTGGDVGGGFLSWLFSPTKWLQSILGPVIDPIAETAQAAIATVDKTVNTVGKTVNLGRAAIEKGSEVVGEVSKVVDLASQGLGGIMSTVPGAALYSAVTPESVKAAMAPPTETTVSNKKIEPAAAMVGGAIAVASSNLNTLPYLLLGTLTLVVLAGFIATYKRSIPIQYAKRQDDTPPEPRVLRNTDRPKA
jgi:TM2 domain-containing membrane protein YozV